MSRPKQIAANRARIAAHGTIARTERPHSELQGGCEVANGRAGADRAHRCCGCIVCLCDPLPTQLKRGQRVRLKGGREGCFERAASTGVIVAFYGLAIEREVVREADLEVVESPAVPALLCAACEAEPSKWCSAACREKAIERLPKAVNDGEPRYFRDSAGHVIGQARPIGEFKPDARGFPLLGFIEPPIEDEIPYSVGLEVIAVGTPTEGLRGVQGVVVEDKGDMCNVRMAARVDGQQTWLIHKSFLVILDRVGPFTVGESVVVVSAKTARHGHSGVIKSHSKRSPEQWHVVFPDGDGVWFETPDIERDMWRRSKPARAHAKADALPPGWEYDILRDVYLLIGDDTRTGVKPSSEETGRWYWWNASEGGHADTRARAMCCSLEIAVRGVAGSYGAYIDDILSNTGTRALALKFNDAESCARAALEAHHALTKGGAA